MRDKEEIYVPQGRRKIPCFARNERQRWIALAQLSLSLIQRNEEKTMKSIEVKHRWFLQVNMPSVILSVAAHSPDVTAGFFDSLVEFA